MSKPVKVYNKGVRPVVFKRDRTGVDAIHPGKFLIFPPSIGDAIIKNFKNACSETDYAKHIKEMAEEQANGKEEATSKTKKKTETKGSK